METNSVMEIIKMADIATKQSDRWLFLATLLLLIFCAVYAFRELMKDRKIVLQDHREDRSAYQASLQKHADALVVIIKDQHTASTAVSVALDRNTEALRENSKLLGKDS